VVKQSSKGHLLTVVVIITCGRRWWKQLVCAQRQPYNGIKYITRRMEDVHTDSCRKICFVQNKLCIKRIKEVCDSCGGVAEQNFKVLKYTEMHLKNSH